MWNKSGTKCDWLTESESLTRKKKNLREEYVNDLCPVNGVLVNTYAKIIDSCQLVHRDMALLFDF